jgi:hypothetical protein
LLWGFDAFGGLLLETVHNIDPLSELDRVERPESAFSKPTN